MSSSQSNSRSQTVLMDINIRDVEKKGGVGSQVYTTLCVNLLTASYGASIGWLSPTLELLKGQNSPLPSGPISIQEASVIGSSSCIGGFISSCLYGWIAEKYGRKVSLITLAIPQMIGWILIYFAQNPYYLVVARFLAGFAGGGIFIVIPLFITEIAEDRIRGRLGTLLIFTMSSGVLIGYVVGDMFDFATTPLCLLMITNIFLAGVIIIHDSPMYLLRKSRFRRAENALKFYRGFSSEEGEMNSKLKVEYDNMTCMIKMANCDSSRGRITIGDFLTKAAKKSLLIGLALMCLDLLSGVYILLSYASMIFDEAGSSLSPNTSAIIIGSIQLVGVYVSTVFVDRAGRKILMVSSAFGCALGLALIAAYDFSKHHGVNVSEYNWIPLASFSFVIFVANLGVTSLPFLVLTEVSPLKIKDVVYSLNLSISWLLAFLELQFFPWSVALLGLYGTMFILACLCFAGAIFIIVCVPETKNRSIEEIQELMAK